MIMQSNLYRAIRRLADIIGSLLVIVVLVIVGPVLALAIKFETSGPVFFQCKRLGQFGRPFTMLKFRTMVHNAPEKFNIDGSRLVEQGDARITRLGALLRHGIDELPQVFSVLRGDLSFIGPRPDDLFATSMYRGSDWLKLSIKPGLTGLSQVSGRNSLPYKDRLIYDAYYAVQGNLWIDIRIVIRTLGVLVGYVPCEPLIDLERCKAELEKSKVCSGLNDETLKDLFYKYR